MKECWVTVLLWWEESSSLVGGKYRYNQGGGEVQVKYRYYQGASKVQEVLKIR